METILHLLVRWASAKCALTMAGLFCVHDFCSEFLKFDMNNLHLKDIDLNKMDAVGGGKTDVNNMVKIIDA